MNSLEIYIQKRKEIQELLEAVKGTTKVVFEEASQELFRSNPSLESFSWTQYTPYFNDGESCEFSVGDIDQINGEDFEDYDCYDYKNGKFTLKKDVTELQKAAHAAIEFKNIFDEDDLLSMFDDHVRVTVTKNGVETEQYDHD